MEQGRSPGKSNDADKGNRSNHTPARANDRGDADVQYSDSNGHRRRNIVSDLNSVPALLL